MLKNQLTNASSLYLKQHGGNPVCWQYWSDETLKFASKEKKLMLVSIGYASCHWCHVMEKECFEDTEVAKLLNEQYIPIKLDREERPDIDMIYMDALRLMRQSGGWPLNCVCLPDGRPVYGGTYFPKKDFLNILSNLHSMWQEEPQKLLDYANKLEKGMAAYGLPPQIEAKNGAVNRAVLKEAYTVWETYFDLENGGHKGAPKFPMPHHWIYMIQYGTLEKNKEAASMAELTVNRISQSGLYDPIEGGFFRYSTDAIWHVPHFEKMLYDNAQFLSLLAEAYRCFKKEDFRRILAKTHAFLNERMAAIQTLTSQTPWEELNTEAYLSRYYFSSIDADSEGVEGKYYSWPLEDINQCLGNDAAFFNTYFQCTERGNWHEMKTNVLCTNKEKDRILKAYNMDEKTATRTLNTCFSILKKHRDKRPHPAIDNKGILSWNGLMLSGLADAYKATQEERYKQDAYALSNTLYGHFRNPDGTYKRILGGSNTPVFIDDYAMLIQGLIKMYELAFDEQFLIEAKRITDYVISQYFDEEKGFFAYADKHAKKIMPQPFDLSDNVINASNSVMAHNLFMLALIFGEERYVEMSKTMLISMLPTMLQQPSFHSNWLQLAMYFAYDFKLLISNHSSLSNEVLQNQVFDAYRPNLFLMRAKPHSLLPVLQDKFNKHRECWFICTQHACSSPYTSFEDIAFED